MIAGALGVGFVEEYSRGQPGRGDGEHCSDGEARAERGVVPGRPAKRRRTSFPLIAAIMSSWPSISSHRGGEDPRHPSGRGFPSLSAPGYSSLRSRNVQPRLARS